jgi:hypothetical protein
VKVPRNRYALVSLGWSVFLLWLAGSGLIARTVVFPIVTRLATAAPEPSRDIITAAKPFIFFFSTVLTLLLTYWLLSRAFTLISPGDRLKDWFVRLNEETIWKR